MNEDADLELLLSRATLDVHQAAKIAKCHPDTLRKMAADRLVPATKIGRAWVFPAKQFLQWIELRCPRVVTPPGSLLGGSTLAARLAARRTQRAR
jgi:excisionase family DNA binding protein